MELINTTLESLEQFSSSPWFYLVILVIAFLDSVFPAVPSEATVILGGIAAGQGELYIVLVILMGLLGAYAGDSMAYFLGRRYGIAVVKRILRGDKVDDQLEKTARQIAKRGGVLLLTARFIPGGRTAVTITCGAAGLPFLAWFTRWDLLATTLWATYAGLIGYFFGERFKDDHTSAFWWAFGTAVTVAVLFEAVRYSRHRWFGRSPVAEPSGDLSV